MMNKTFEKVKGLSNRFFHFCCFGSATGYGFSHAYSRTAARQIDQIEPYFDDVMLPICDNLDVEMFVFYFLCISLCSVCQMPNLFQFAILTRFEDKMQSWHINWSNEFNTFPLFNETKRK